jgi:hypothetical protein
MANTARRKAARIWLFIAGILDQSQADHIIKCGLYFLQ